LASWTSLKREVARSCGWNLHDIDECDVTNFIQFFNQGEDPDTHVVDGVIYRRAKGVPSFL